MTNDVRHLAAQVGAKANLRDVALRTLHSDLALGEADDKLSIDVSWETAFERLGEDEVEYRYRLAVEGRPAVAFSITAEFALTYTIGAAFSDEQLSAFGEVSVAFSAMPYARELVQSLTTRASLPPLVLATLRAPIDPPAEEASPSSTDGGSDGTKVTGTRTSKSPSKRTKPGTTKKPQP